MTSSPPSAPAQPRSAWRVAIAQVGRRLARLASRLGFRILAFNVLLVFVPLVAVFSLEVYEEQLLRGQERAMVQQGRLLAAALGGGDGLDADYIAALFERLERRTSARLRVLDRTGLVLADTSALGPRLDDVEGEVDGSEETVSEGWLYRLGALPFRFGRPRVESAGSSPLDVGPGGVLMGSEIAAAIEGRYGAATRITEGQRSVTLSSAIPIRQGGSVVGVAHVSQSTRQLLEDLYDVRVLIFGVFLVSLAVAAVLSLVVATTISRPLRGLRRRTITLLDARGRLTGAFPESRRTDEIGDLSRALRELSRRLRENQRLAESFASDLSHEFKNPLSAIRSATDLLDEVDDSATRARFLEIIQSNTARLERMLTRVRELSAIDAGLDDEPTEAIVVGERVRDLLRAWRIRRSTALEIELVDESDGAVVEMSPDHLAQVFDNLVDNAASFSPPGGTIRVHLGLRDDQLSLAVEDEGSGIPGEHRDRVFDRFFSYRPTADDVEERGADEGHIGLGLAVVKSVVESYGGRGRVGEKASPGARLEVHLPLAST